jgi:hypothetical protein
MRLMYLAKKLRNDILLPVSFLATRAKVPTADDWTKLKLIYKYLNGTKVHGLRIPPDDLRIHAYVDARFAVHSDEKGH